jgi:hypothetical protein
VDEGDLVVSNCRKRLELRDCSGVGGVDAVVYISLLEKSNDVGSINCNGDFLLLAGDDEDKNEFKSFVGDVAVKSKSKEFIGDETFP